MLKTWHKEDIFAALKSRGWGEPSPLDVVSYMVGESYAFTRGAEVLKLFFVADMGAGFTGKKSIEAASARIEPEGEPYDLWLRSARDARWKKELHDWAEQVSSATQGSVTSNEI
jgi:hypothetical protein